MFEESNVNAVPPHDSDSKRTKISDGSNFFALEK